MDYSDYSKEVYLYRFNTKGEFEEIKGYIKNFTKMNNLCASLTFREFDDKGKVKTRVNVSGNEGEIYNNTVWFSEPDRLGALEVIKEHKMNLIKKHKEIIDKLRADIYRINIEIRTKNKG